PLQTWMSFFSSALAGAFSSANARVPAAIPATTAPIALVKCLRSIRFISLNEAARVAPGLRDSKLLPNARTIPRPVKDASAQPRGCGLECTTQHDDPRPRTVDPPAARRDRPAPGGGRASGDPSPAGRG